MTSAKLVNLPLQEQAKGTFNEKYPPHAVERTVRHIKRAMIGNGLPFFAAHSTDSQCYTAMAEALLPSVMDKNPARALDVVCLRLLGRKLKRSLPAAQQSAFDAYDVVHALNESFPPGQGDYSQVPAKITAATFAPEATQPAPEPVQMVETWPIKGFDPTGEPHVHVLSDGTGRLVFQHMPPSDLRGLHSGDAHGGPEWGTALGPLARLDTEMARSLGCEPVWQEPLEMRVAACTPKMAHQLAELVGAYRARCIDGVRVMEITAMPPGAAPEAVRSQWLGCTGCR